MQYDVIIIGAGAAGLLCAIEAGKRGRTVLLIDHAKKPAEKIRISGGGRCNFTNLHATPKQYLSNNPHFCISAFTRYTQHDFIALVEKHGIAYHEKTLGQLFCDGSSQQIITMLLDECADASVILKLDTSVQAVTRTEESTQRYRLTTTQGEVSCTSLVIASGGKSIPKMGATGFGYDIARQFELNIISTRPALVPFTFEGEMLNTIKQLAGISVDASVFCNGMSFDEGLLFTHRGLSGPAILQISSYWNPGDVVTINLAPHVDVWDALNAEREMAPKQKPPALLTTFLPKRLSAQICDDVGCDIKLAEISNKKLRALADAVNHWTVKPPATEGYRTAEVTIGGVDTEVLSSKSMECKTVPGLYFIGEVVDVTGHLGGFNFQWAWSSGFAAGQYV